MAPISSASGTDPELGGREMRNASRNLRSNTVGAVAKSRNGVARQFEEVCLWIGLLRVDLGVRRRPGPAEGRMPSRRPRRRRRSRRL
jgi:hypothetical protein